MSRQERLGIVPVRRVVKDGIKVQLVDRRSLGRLVRDGDVDRGEKTIEHRVREGEESRELLGGGGGRGSDGFGRESSSEG